MCKHIGCGLNDSHRALVVTGCVSCCQVHRQYFEAGADVATASSYQATIQGFVERVRCPSLSKPRQTSFVYRRSPTRDAHPMAWCCIQRAVTKDIIGGSSGAMLVCTSSAG
jgi:hypothetical protein